ncbi:hypothetical protein JCM10914A_28330 [Paenibacillus sp. JCM 10914]|uniref:hypothetical protein n=1 Tax=Paenibacillus sp. JCM 10914 TaxID=1236974 RepID=UPI0003CC2922|nr:hypothetical protein [Paenibacillus sp. JCM 10914]GAE09664.1 hypothetical protein JCM10914_6038 [Paenibacillus sp. JCM 10914]
MKANKSAAAAILALTLTLPAGILSTINAADAAPVNEAEATQGAASSNKATAFGNAVYNKATKLLKEQDVAYAKAYITKHIRSVTPYQATMLVLKLENAIDKALSAKTDAIYKIGIQDELMKLYKYGESIQTTINKIKNDALKQMLINLRDGGYKLHTTEGVVFPIVDYKSLEIYKPYINQDIRAYIDIMVVESEKVAVNDGALVISWSEVIQRGVAQENFLQSYPKSNRVADVERMLRFTELSLFYGYNNTPLFMYENNQLDPKARQALDKALAGKDVADHAFLSKLKEWSDVLKANQDRLTEEVQQHRSKAVPLDV